MRLPAHFSLLIFCVFILSGCPADNDSDSNNVYYGNNASQNTATTNNTTGNTNNTNTINNTTTNNGSTNNATGNNTTTILPPVICNDEVLGNNEECDGDKFGNASCESLIPGSVGELACDQNCEIDTDGCEIPACGNGTLESDEGEECDPNLAVLDECDTLPGFISGMLTCSDDCKILTTECVPLECGDGLVSANEECDRGNFLNATCDGLVPGSEGELTCDATCKVNTDKCIIATCGNGILDPNEGEECDTNLAILDDCQSLPGFVSGSLSCDSDCKLVTAACVPIVCGDGIISDGEECDPIAGAPIESCETLGFGKGFSALSPTCDQCQYNTTDCEGRSLSYTGPSACVLDPSAATPVACWGLNLGVNSGLAAAVDPPAAQTLFTQVSTGSRHICGLKTDGTIRCWGRNASLEAGVDGYLHTVANAMFQETADNKDFVQVSAGPRYNSCGLKNDGTIACWGTNKVVIPGAGYKYVEAGFQKYTLAGSPLVSKARACALTSTNQIACYTNTDPLTLTTTQYSQFSTAESHDCGLKMDGTIECWGPVPNISYGPDVAINSDFVHVSAGGRQGARLSCGLKIDGSVHCWGEYSLTVNATPTVTKFVQIEVGDTAVCGLKKTDGTIECWGPNSYAIKSQNPDFCGNGVVDVNEVCDTVQTKTCDELGYGARGSNIPPCRDTCLIKATDCN